MRHKKSLANILKVKFYSFTPVLTQTNGAHTNNRQTTPHSPQHFSAGTTLGMLLADWLTLHNY